MSSHDVASPAAPSRNPCCLCWCCCCSCSWYVGPGVHSAPEERTGELNRRRTQGPASQTLRGLQKCHQQAGCPCHPQHSSSGGQWPVPRPLCTCAVPHPYAQHMLTDAAVSQPCWPQGPYRLRWRGTEQRPGPGDDEDKLPERPAGRAEGPSSGTKVFHGKLLLVPGRGLAHLRLRPLAVEWAVLWEPKGDT